MTYQSYSSTSKSGRSEAEMISATTLTGHRLRTKSREDLWNLE